MYESAMIRTAKRLASLRLTLVGMLMLAVLAVLGVRSDAVSIDMTTIPLVLLAMNLVAALMTNRTLRTQAGLLVFHVGLLMVFGLIGLSVLTRFDGHVEVAQGAGFEPAAVTTTANGWLHDNRLDGIEFYQSDIRVDYLPRLVRQETRSTVEYRGADGAMHRATIGDKVGFEVDGYRFLATFNKGFALLLHWQDDTGAEAIGAVNFLSFPRHDWNQVTTWTTPAGQEVELEIDFDEPYFNDDSAWTLCRESRRWYFARRRPSSLDGVSHRLPAVPAVDVGCSDARHRRAGNTLREPLPDGNGKVGDSYRRRRRRSCSPRLNGN